MTDQQAHMKNSTLINYIDVYGNERRLIVHTPFLLFLQAQLFPWDFMIFCTTEEKLALSDKMEELFKAKTKRCEKPEPLWGPYGR